MTANRILTAALVVLAPLVYACKKSEEKKPEPAPAPAPAAKPAPAPAPAPVASKITVKTPSDDDSGDYDGGNAILVHSDPIRTVAIPKGCPTFSCDMVRYDGATTDAWKKACPHARILVVKLGDYGHKDDPKAGPTKSELDVSMDGASNGVSAGQWVDGVTLTEVAADHISGSIDLSSDNQVHGSFKAKVCPKT